MTFDDCRRKPACVDTSWTPDPATDFGNWDHKCSVCGGTSAVDQAFDGGVEDSGCQKSALLHSVGEPCDDGDPSDLVLLSECDSVPSCAE
jgi:hypothetical protein